MEKQKALTGLARRELWVDARDLQRGEEGGEDQLSPEEYAAVLATRGREKLGEHPLAQSFEATVRAQNAAFEYGSDYLLGDKITVIDRNLGVTVNAVVTGAEYAFSREGQSFCLTLGYGQPTVARQLARKAEK